MNNFRLRDYHSFFFFFFFGGSSKCPRTPLRLASSCSPQPWPPAPICGNGRASARQCPGCCRARQEAPCIHTTHDDSHDTKPHARLFAFTPVFDHHHRALTGSCQLGGHKPPTHARTHARTHVHTDMHAPGGCQPIHGTENEQANLPVQSPHAFNARTYARTYLLAALLAPCRLVGHTERKRDRKALDRPRPAAHLPVG